MPHQYRMLLYSKERELPIVIELAGARGDIEARTKIIAALDLMIIKAEVWDGSKRIMAIDEHGLAALRSISELSNDKSVDLGTPH